MSITMKLNLFFDNPGIITVKMSLQIAQLNSTIVILISTLINMNVL